ncbi:MAG: ERF family protein [Erysipelotrichaceae bacterium]|nr:ERF family protein [Erysipelotrichaceae bacterium]
MAQNLKEKLSLIQNELKAPKNQYNSFGKYKYRNCEDILEAVKPICKKYRTTLLIEDSISQVGERYYVKATASLLDWDANEEFSVQAYAREELEKKGMDASQVTGATSSYARKYALNGLFNIDDTKDTDSEEYQAKGKAEPKAEVKLATKNQIEMIVTLYKPEELTTMLGRLNKNIDELSVEEASKMIKARKG